MTEIKQISEEVFWTEYVPMEIEYGEGHVINDIEKTKQYPLNQVWTIVDSGQCDNENLYALPGYHRVNKIGYVVTEKVWENSLDEAVYMDYATNYIVRGTD